MNYKQLNTLNVLLNKCSHRILGIQSYKMTTTDILKLLNWMTIQHMVVYQSLKIIHRLDITNEPKALKQYIFRPLQRTNNDRQAKRLSLQYKYNTAKCKNTFFHRTIYIYNNIGEDIKNMTKTQFKKYLKDYIRANIEPKSIPKIPDS